MVDDERTINLDTYLTINTEKKIITALSIDLREVMKVPESEVKKSNSVRKILLFIQEIKIQNYLYEFFKAVVNSKRKIKHIETYF